MARKRTIDPGFFRNDALGECSPLARLFFAGLWCWADRDGRLEDRPKRLAAEILPYDRAEGEALMQELATAGMVVRYEAEGVRYVEIPSFGKYQNPHPKETPSRFPPREGSPKVDPRTTQGEPKDNPGAAEGEPFRAQPSSLLASSLPQPSRPSRQPPNPPRLADSVQPEFRLADLRSRLAHELGLPKMLGLGRNPEAVVGSFQRWLDTIGEDDLVLECLRLAGEKNVVPSNLAWFAGWLDTVSTPELQRLASRRASP